MIRHYLRELEVALASYAWIKSVQVTRCDFFETQSEQILIYRFRVSLAGNALLELMERVIHSREARITRNTTYRFHWQNEDGTLVRRWDSAPHFPGLAAFPHHIHIGEDNIVLPGKPMNAFEVLAEINESFLSS